MVKNQIGQNLKLQTQKDVVTFSWQHGFILLSQCWTLAAAVVILQAPKWCQMV